MDMNIKVIFFFFDCNATLFMRRHRGGKHNLYKMGKITLCNLGYK